MDIAVFQWIGAVVLILFGLVGLALQRRLHEVGLVWVLLSACCWEGLQSLLLESVWSVCTCWYVFFETDYSFLSGVSVCN
jgi:drug/metabolite transporter (DMT)-like permease